MGGALFSHDGRGRLTENRLRFFRQNPPFRILPETRSQTGLTIGVPLIFSQLNRLRNPAGTRAPRVSGHPAPGRGKAFSFSKSSASAS